MSIISASFIFLICFVSFSTGCIPSVITDPIAALADQWGGIDFQWLSYDFPLDDLCPDIPGLDCGYWVGQASNGDIETTIFLADYMKK